MLAAFVVGAGALTGCSVPDATLPGPVPTTASPRTPSASAGADPADLASRARTALAAIAAAAGSDAVGSLAVRPGTAEAIIVKGSSAERWSVVKGSPVLSLAIAHSTEWSSVPAASFPVDAVAQLRPALAECPTDYVARVQVLPSRGTVATLECGGGENNPSVAQVLGGVRLGALRDRFAPDTLAEVFREAAAVAPIGQVRSIDLAGAAGDKTPSVAIGLPGYDAGGYRCAPATWTRPLAAGDRGFVVGAPCSATTDPPAAEQLLAPSTLDPASVVKAIEEAKSQLGSDLSGASSVRLTMTGNGVVLQADDTTGAAPGSAYVRVVPLTTG